MKSRYSSPAYYLGFGSFLVSVIFLFIIPVLSAIFLSLFILVCLIAPFFPRIGFFLPVIFHGTSGKQEVALTFDDGPDPLTTPPLLKLLSKYNVKATFFVLGARAEKYPQIIKEILASGHSIGNHTYHHDVMIMLKSKKKLEKEIELTQNLLKSFGIIPFAFRPPAGIVNPRLGPILQKQNMFCLHYSCRGFDVGNRRITYLSKKVLNKVRKGDIILLHDCKPRYDSQIIEWLNEIESILKGISLRGLSILPLSEVIGKEIMGSAPNFSC